MQNRRVQKPSLSIIAMLLSCVGAVAQTLANNSDPASPAGPRVNVVEHGESAVSPEACRGIVVGPGVNQPDPFPGYGGFVGWESPVRLTNGVWLVGFNAGYWHASPPTPLHYSPKTLEHYRKLGMPPDITAPTGGRAMVTRSTDGGKFWSKPVTLIDTPADDRHPAFVQLADGTVLCSFFTYWGEPGQGAPGKDPAQSVRVFFLRSFDGGLTWEKEPRQLKTPFLSEDRRPVGPPQRRFGSRGDKWPPGG